MMGSISLPHFLTISICYSSMHCEIIDCLADPFIIEGINTSSEVTYFPLDDHTVGDEIMYLSKTY